MHILKKEKIHINTNSFIVIKIVLIFIFLRYKSINVLK